MTSQTQTRKIKCPHCGWVRTLTIEVNDTGDIVVRGLGDTLKDFASQVKNFIADAQLTEANAWIDAPACPHCSNTYQYNTHTGLTRP